MFKLDISAIDGDFSKSDTNIQTLIHDWIGQNWHNSERIVSNDGVNVIRPGNQETYLALEKERISRNLHLDILSDYEFLSPIELTEEKARELIANLQVRAEHEDNHDPIEIKTKLGNCFVLPVEAYKKDFEADLFPQSKHADLMPCPNAIGRKDCIVVQDLHYSKLTFVIDTAGTAKNIKSITDRPLEKKSVINALPLYCFEADFGDSEFAIETPPIIYNGDYASLMSIKAQYDSIYDLPEEHEDIFNPIGFSNSAEIPFVVYGSTALSKKLTGKDFVDADKDTYFNIETYYFIDDDSLMRMGATGDSIHISVAEYAVNDNGHLVQDYSSFELKKGQVVKLRDEHTSKKEGGPLITLVDNSELKLKKRLTKKMTENNDFIPF
jgi:hypothetical protein